MVALELPISFSNEGGDRFEKAANVYFTQLASGIGVAADIYVLSISARRCHGVSELCAV